MNEQRKVLESTTILNSINKNGITVLNMFNDDYRKFLTEILILESLNIKNTWVVQMHFFPLLVAMPLQNIITLVNKLNYSDI